MKKVERPKKPLLMYYAMALILLILLNTLLFPVLSGNQVSEVDYGTFLNMVEEKKSFQGGTGRGYHLFYR